MNSPKTLQSLGKKAARPWAGSTAPDASGTADDPTASAEDPLSKDELFHLLQNSRRRAVLRYLQGREGPVRMRDVAEQVAAWEHDTTVARLTSDERQRVYIALYQSHLDALADAGVIEYNKSRGVVEAGPLLDQVTPYLDVDRGESIEEADGDPGEWEWEWMYLAVSVVGTLLLVGTALGLSTLGAIPGLAVSGLVLSAFVALTLAKFALDRTRTGSD